jgi:hypothetical protein
MRFEEERGVNLGLHQLRAGSGEPAVELLGPRAVEIWRRCRHVTFDSRNRVILFEQEKIVISCVCVEVLPHWV